MDITAALLEHGVPSVCLVIILLYLLRFHIPNLIVTFKEGFDSLRGVLRSINEKLREVHRCVKASSQRTIDCNNKELKDFAREWREHDKDMRAEVQELRGELEKLQEVIKKQND